MKRKYIFIFICLISALSLYSVENTIKAAGGLTWFTSYNAAIEDAEKKQNIILVNFTGSDWCEWCKKLDKDVFSKDEFHKWQKDNVTLLYLDFPQSKKLSTEQTNHNQMLLEVYGVKGFPTILLLSPEGQLIGRAGYLDDVTKWIENVKNNIDMFETYVDKL